MRLSTVFGAGAIFAPATLGAMYLFDVAKTDFFTGWIDGFLFGSYAVAAMALRRMGR